MSQTNTLSRASFRRASTHFTLALAGCALLLSSGCKKPANAELKTDQDKTLYALGLVLGKNITPFSLTAEELEKVKAGLADGATKKEPKVKLEEWGPKIQELAMARAATAAEAQKKESSGFLEKAGKEPGAEVKPSGLIFTTLTEGSGAQPSATSTVKVNYEGKLSDGTVFDSSIQRGEPVEFPLNQVIPCWTEGVQLMKVGQKAKLVCPSDIAYGDQGRPPQIPGGATLVFEIELLEVK